MDTVDREAPLGAQLAGFDVPARALGRWLALQAALRALPCEPVCASSPETWWASSPVLVEDARYGCSRCPVETECASYAVVADEPGGVWGGTTDADRRRWSGRKR